MIKRQWKFEIDRLRLMLNHPQGPPKELLAEFLDMVELGIDRITAEQARSKAQEKQMEIALCHGADSVVVLDIQGGIRLANPAFGELVGLKGVQLIGRRFEDFLDHNGRNDWESIQIRLTLGHDFRGRLKSLLQGKERLTIDLSAISVPDPLAGPGHFVLSLRDITKQLADESRIEGQKNFLENLFNLSDNALGVLDKHNHWLLDNRALRELGLALGPQGPENLAQELKGLFGNSDRLERRRLTLKFASEQERVYLLQGQKVPASDLLGVTTEKFLWIVTLSDLTELEGQRGELAAKTMALGFNGLIRQWTHKELTNSLAMQLRQPINLSRAMAMRLKSMATAEQEGTLTNLLAQLEGMESTLLESFRGPIPEGFGQGITFSLELEKSLGHLYGLQLVRQGQKLRFENPDPGLTYPMSHEVLLLLVGLLIDNGTEASGEGGVVLVRFFQNPLGRHISVEDSGPGIAPGLEYKIFEPSFSTKPGHEGLSLSLVFQMVNQAGARVNVSRSGLGGACLTLSFGGTP
ncbi:MAG: hypothetical protein A2600_10005 [Candidatus Lambdaproteobacteria bacterium RIFOXYD1_FULL_56_27]|nr:MAG: hypothetical protein A2600_10005 [Candidatus Lambdaproteobacteria bacterium RIFOXYD1_FULL_56_27]